MTQLVLISKLPGDISQLAVYSGNKEAAAFRVATELLDCEMVEEVRVAEYKPIENVTD